MEFGEVSNTCNFTPPNVALHLSVAAVITALGSLSFVDGRRATPGKRLNFPVSPHINF